MSCHKFPHVQLTRTAVGVQSIQIAEIFGICIRYYVVMPTIDHSTRSATRFSRASSRHRKSSRSVKEEHLSLLEPVSLQESPLNFCGLRTESQSKLINRRTSVMANPPHPRISADPNLDYILLHTGLKVAETLSLAVPPAYLIFHAFRGKHPFSVNRFLGATWMTSLGGAVASMPVAYYRLKDEAPIAMQSRMERLVSSGGAISIYRH